MSCRLHPAIAVLLLTLLGSLASWANSPTSAGQIVWQKDLKVAQDLATAENKVVFIALNMDGERANDRMAKDVYSDKQVIALTEKTLNVVGSRFEHGSGECKRFGGVTCADHQSVDIAIRLRVLELPADANVVAPQHIFVGPDGKILLSVAYEITAKQLMWCLVTAINKANPEAKLSMPAGAKAPRRVMLDGVAATEGSDISIPPLSRVELANAMIFIRSGAKGAARVDVIRSMLGTDDPDAIEFLEKELGDFRYERRADQLTRLLLAVGGASPPSFWETIDHFLKSSDEEFRSLTAVAMEQLAAPKSVKTLKTYFAKEKSSKVRKNLLRAIGVAGADDKSARGILLKAWKNTKEPLLQTNALLVLGLHASDKKALAAIEEGLNSNMPEHRQAAALGLAFARAKDQAELLKGYVEAEKEADCKKVMQSCLEVLNDGTLRIIAEDFARVAQDEHPRPRFFGMPKTKAAK
ncbi:MAG: hypothetical protein H8E15_00410 [Planctomycetes bacterium]|nr:hypothetical protein [Planctomycetota bacterium]